MIFYFKLEILFASFLSQHGTKEDLPVAALMQQSLMQMTSRLAFRCDTVLRKICLLLLSHNKRQVTSRQHISRRYSYLHF